MSEEQTYETPEDAGTASDERVEFWLNELRLADRREKEWREAAGKVVRIYEAEERPQNSFNILYSNTETLLPATYNNTPRPVVRRRFKDPDPLAHLAAKAATRFLEYALDTGLQDTTLDEAFQQSVTDAAVPGRGVLWLEPFDTAVLPILVPWDRFRHSYGRFWSDVWWTARWEDMTRDELVANFGDVGKDIPLVEAKLDNESDEAKKGGLFGGTLADNKGSLKVARVWQIWNKRDSKVLFLCESYPQGFLREIDDPYSLSGFFPHTRPLTFVQKVSGLTPVIPYDFYKEQAEELNRITQRINRIISVMKVRGIYDSTVEELGKVFNLDDGELTPAENLASLSSGQGQAALDEAIWLVPIEKLVSVLQQLYAQREQVKQVIYEITGLADILRGASKASETLGAQEIKERWGGLRIKRIQKQVQLFVRNNLRLILELMVSTLPVRVLAELSQLSLPSREQKQQAMALAQQLQGQEPPPEIAQVLQLPAFDDVLDLLKNDLQRNFRIDIETNSTVDIEATEDKELIAEFMTATGQFLNGVGPLVQQGVLPFEAAQTMLLTISRRFRFGDEVEEQLRQMQPPKPPEQDNSKQLELQVRQAEKQADLTFAKQKHEQELAQDRERHEQDMVFKREELALEREKLGLERERLDFEKGSKALDHLVRGLELDKDEETRELDRQEQRTARDEERADRTSERLAAQSTPPAEDPAERVVTALADQMSTIAEQLQALQDNVAGLVDGLAKVQDTRQEEPGKPDPLAMSLSAFAAVLEKMNSPKRIVRDENGDIAGIQ